MKRKLLWLVLACLPAPAFSERLSDWLLAHPAHPDDYPLGLSWRVPGEKAAQSELYYDLLDSLALPSQQGMKRLLSGLEITGRVPVAAADARWLQANPARDPLISQGDSVVIARRPRTVTVVLPEGRLCNSLHAEKRYAVDYLKACSFDARPDWAWLAEPDGRVERIGVAAWNDQKQDEPAPGAWIWAPEKGWPEDFSSRLGAFLATQGPAPDPIDRNPLAAPPLSSARHRDMPVTANDWGEAGLLQTPTARMRPEGDFSFSLSRVYPYTRGNVFAQPFDWLEAGFRYTNVSNRLYGPVIAGSQAFKDKSVDLKFRLNQESAYFPEIALGLRDLVGTGIFSGEYLVAGKRSGDFDWSLGLGWGYVGARGNISNPLGGAFNSRPAPTGTGNFSLSSYFRGPASLFGGVQYQTPWDRLLLKLEYDGNDYQHEPLFNNQPQRSPWNFAAVYRAMRTLDLSAGLERGNTAMISLTLHAPLDQLTMPKLDDPPRVAVSPALPVKKPDWAKTGRDLSSQTRWHVGEIAESKQALRLEIDGASEVYRRDYLDRAAAVLHRDAPASVRRFDFVYRKEGVVVAENDVDREAWVAQHTRPVPPSSALDPVLAREPAKKPEATVVFRQDAPAFESKLGLNFNYNLGGPNGFLLYQVSPIERAKLRLGDNTWIQGGVQLDVLDNFAKFTYTAPSNLPRVRTYAREYMTSSKLTMPDLQVTHVGRIRDNQYWSVYGGYLEEMFGGVGAEWLYRPFASPLSIGVDVNAVKQRGFKQDFGFMNYQVLTGHTTLYWDTGWNDVEADLSAGRYLAGDVGFTVDLSRSFKNGVRMGAYITKTNVSSQQFGEGSFDKGIYVRIPFDAMLTRSSDMVGNFQWKPLTRDGGAKLDRRVTLREFTQARDRLALSYVPAPLPDYASIPEDQKPAPLPAATELRVVPRPAPERWQAEEDRFDSRLRMALNDRGFRNVVISMAGNRLKVGIDGESIRPLNRAAMAAARISLANAPLGLNGLRIEFAGRAVYDFFSPRELERFFAGEISLAELKKYVDISYPDPTYREPEPLSAKLGSEQPDLADAVLRGRHPLSRIERDAAMAAEIGAGVDWWKTGLWGAGLVLGSALLDKRADNFAVNHGQNRFVKAGNAFGNALPWAGAAGAALAVFSNDPRLANTAFSASEAAVASYATVLGLKYAVGRARPGAGPGSGSFRPFSGAAGYDGFPSGHSIVAWAIATPFAMEYDSPWLYGLASVTNLARVGSRNHWLSDTVAGSFLGYGIGRLFWQSSKASGKPQMTLSPSGVDFSWALQ